MPEVKGKMETTYCWTCDACQTVNRVLDDKHCVKCGKEVGAETMLRHFKLTPEPIRMGFRMF
jgi:hypothetical protein